MVRRITATKLAAPLDNDGHIDVALGKTIVKIVE